MWEVEDAKKHPFNIYLSIQINWSENNEPKVYALSLELTDMDHFDILIVKLIISYFVRKETNVRNWPPPITQFIAEYASFVFLSLYYRAFCIFA